MRNVWIRITAMSNISMNTSEDTGIPVEDWAKMTYEEKQTVIEEVVWEDIEAYAVTEDGEYLE